MRYFLGDVETSGLTNNDKVVELAWIEFDEDLNILESVHSLIDPEIPINPGASGIHGITNKDVEDAPTIEEFFCVVRGTGPITDDLVFSAHNTPFDRRFFGPWLPGLQAELCTLRLARRVFPEAENHKLPTLMYHLDLVRGTSHRADGDVQTTFDLLRKIKEKCGLSIESMIDLCAMPLKVAKLPFGKHKGSALSDIPKSYRAWLLGQDIDKDLRWSLEQLA